MNRHAEPAGIVYDAACAHLADPAGNQAVRDDPPTELLRILRTAAHLAERRLLDEITVVVSAPNTLRRLGVQLKQAGGRHLQEWTLVGLEMGPWSSWRAQRQPTVHLHCLASGSPTRTLYEPHTPPSVIAHRLAEYHQALGAPWQMTAGVSGCASVRARYPSRAPGQAPYWGAGARATIGDTRQAAGDLNWHRPLLKTETAMGWLHTIDLNSARLAAANTSWLPWSKPEPGPHIFDRDMAGYWLIRRTELPHPHRLAPSMIPDGRGELVHVTSPIMIELENQGINPEIVESCVAVESRRWLYEWARNLDHIRTQHPNTVIRQASKQTYKEMFGLWAREGGSIYNPLAAHTVIDRGRITILRHINAIAEKTGRYPVRVATDALTYAHSSDNVMDMIDEFGVKFDNTKLGHFKHSHTTAIQDLVKTR